MRVLLLTLAATLALGCNSDDGDGAPEIPDNRCPDCVAPPPVVEHSPLTAVIGGTLAIAPDGVTAVVADPEQHQIFVVDLQKRAVRGQLDLPGGEPARVAVNASAAYVALRTGGVVVVKLSDGSEAARFGTCAAPRGLALDGDRLHVACAGGDLMTFDAEAGRLLARVHLAPDLRDVVVSGDRLLVTRFRSAEVLVVADGEVVDRWHPRSERPEDGVLVSTEPTVAWRAVPTADGGLAVLHQRAQTSRIITREEGGYGTGDGRCSRSIVAPAVTIFDAEGGIVRDGVLSNTVLGVDLAFDGERVLIAAAGQQIGSAQQVHLENQPLGCFRAGAGGQLAESDTQVVAVALDGAGHGWALGRQPLTLYDMDGDARIALSGRAAGDTGHSLFHRDAGGGIACASCHPEGSDDGHTWLFEGVGLRRTQNLRGGLMGSEPFHWEGDLPDMEALVAEVMVKRMGGQPLGAGHTDRLLRWIDAQPAIRVDVPTTGSAEAGQALFEDPAIGCVGCHLADGTGDGKTYDVGTGGYFQVPSLVGVASRAPYLHDGCAPTLHDRFGPCGGGDAHGRTSALDAPQVESLVAFLSTL